MFHSRSEKVGALRHEWELTRLAESNEKSIGVLGDAASRKKVGVGIQDQAETFVSANLWTWISSDIAHNTVSTIQGPCSVLQT